MMVTAKNKSSVLFRELSEENAAMISGGVVEVTSSAEVKLTEPSTIKLTEPSTNRNVLVIDRIPNLLAPNNNLFVERTAITNNSSLRVALRILGLE
ncbi:hypothetical protein [Iningainema tapete]|uniref:Uncharacterized protein n=1 Tax=Iningainema tapete BLCC-T55 TaxID=2748662 RepID=A0A8J6XNZ0_9CYAN|nr:hypothetical protein [Iningainema tapete]MBD2778613.1 hypothetical protein [Iningainema tapete BLCC-T55]